MTLSFPRAGWIIALLSWICAGPVLAQPNAAQEATPYFHGAAQQYVAADLQRALATVNEGLRVAPGDARLQALRNAIEQQRRRSGQGGGQEDAPQSGQNTSNGGDQSGRESQNQRGNAEQQDRSGEQPNDPSQGSGAQGRDGADSSPSEASDGSSGRAVKPGGDPQQPSLSQAQAARILRALESQEKQLLRQVLKRERKPQRILKEW